MAGQQAEPFNNIGTNILAHDLIILLLKITVNGHGNKVQDTCLQHAIRSLFSSSFSSHLSIRPSLTIYRQTPQRTAD